MPRYFRRGKIDRKVGIRFLSKRSALKLRRSKRRAHVDGVSREKNLATLTFPRFEETISGKKKMATRVPLSYPTGISSVEEKNVVKKKVWITYRMSGCRHGYRCRVNTGARIHVTPKCFATTSLPHVVEEPRSDVPTVIHHSREVRRGEE